MDHAATTVPQSLGRLRIALDDAFRRASRGVGLTPQQAELLCAALAPASVGDLAGQLGCDRSNVSRLVDRASARGLVERAGTAEDGRVTLIELTAEGERLARRLIAALERQTEELRAEWSRRRLDEAVSILNDVADALEGRS
jgi:DNA-binding MarR family transcriptional regulator